MIFLSSHPPWLLTRLQYNYFLFKTIQSTTLLSQRWTETPELLGRISTSDHNLGALPIIALVLVLLYPPSPPHCTSAAHLPHPLPKRVRLWGVHWHTPTLTLTDSLTLIAFSASAPMSAHFSTAKRAVRCRLNAFCLRGMASAQRLKHSTETQNTTAHYVRRAVNTPPQPSTPCASATASALPRAQTLVLEGKAATEHCGSEHSCTPCACAPCANLALASAPPLSSTSRGVVIFDKERLRSVFAKIVAN